MEENLSPWELEPLKIAEDGRPTVCGDGVPVLQDETATTLYRPQPEYGGRGSMIETPKWVKRPNCCWVEPSDELGNGETFRFTSQTISQIRVHRRIPNRSLPHQSSTGQSFLFMGLGRRVGCYVRPHQRLQI